MPWKLEYDNAGRLTPRTFATLTEALRFREQCFELGGFATMPIEVNAPSDPDCDAYNGVDGR